MPDVTSCFLHASCVVLFYWCLTSHLLFLMPDVTPCFVGVLSFLSFVPLVSSSYPYRILIVSSSFPYRFLIVSLSFPYRFLVVCTYSFFIVLSCATHDELATVIIPAFRLKKQPSTYLTRNTCMYAHICARHAKLRLVKLRPGREANLKLGIKAKGTQLSSRRFS